MINESKVVRIPYWQREMLVVAALGTPYLKPLGSVDIGVVITMSAESAAKARRFLRTRYEEVSHGPSADGLQSHTYVFVPGCGLKFREYRLQSKRLSCEVNFFFTPTIHIMPDHIQPVPYYRCDHQEPLESDEEVVNWYKDKAISDMEHPPHHQSFGCFVDAPKPDCEEPNSRWPVDVEMSLTLDAARKRFGKLTHATMGGPTRYLEFTDAYGTWKPVYLEFFGKVVSYRLQPKENDHEA